jgi:hypothetical protein
MTADHGWVYDRRLLAPEAEAMTEPVACRCGAVYDLAAVTDIIARYADATRFRAPCCGVEADERRWVPQPYERLRR